ncbi:MAG: hypothetical protein QOI01_1494 [Mycobacterium sp.]|jgi:hypothetical protein|nr:hypothetical protein [Mycobacterium sp.]
MMLDVSMPREAGATLESTTPTARPGGLPAPASSTPDREFEETSEKLMALAPYLVPL